MLSHRRSFLHFKTLCIWIVLFSNNWLLICYSLNYFFVFVIYTLDFSSSFFVCSEMIAFNNSIVICFKSVFKYFINKYFVLSFYLLFFFFELVLPGFILHLVYHINIVLWGWVNWYFSIHHCVDTFQIHIVLLFLSNFIVKPAIIWEQTFKTRAIFHILFLQWKENMV